MKEDEKILLQLIQVQDDLVQPNISPIQIARRLKIPEKRAHYIFLKWSDKGWYDYGVSCRVGWLTEKGKKINIEDLKWV